MMQKELSVLGVVLSLICAELTGISPGGLIVPGFLCLYLRSPVRLGITFAVALLSVLLGKGMKRWLFVYGRRQFTLMIVTAFVMDALLSKILPPEMQVGVIGTLIPGILANTCLKQGVLNTFLAQLTVMALLVLAAWAFMGVRLL